MISASDTLGGDLQDKEFTLSPDDSDSDSCDFADGPVYSHGDARANLRRAFKAICDLRNSANGAIPEHATGVFTLALQNLNAII